MSVIVSNPNSTSQNVIQATADVPDLTLRPFSDAQTSNVFRTQNAAGTIDVLTIGPTGLLTITPDDDATGGLLIRPHSAAQSGILLDVIGKAGIGEVRVNSRGNLLLFSASGETPFSITDTTFSAATVQMFSSTNGAAIEARALDNGDEAGKFVAPPVPTVPVFRVTKSDFTTNLFAIGMIGGNGSLGVFGAVPVVKQTGASAAGIAAIVDPNAKAAIAALQTALAAYGLVTSPA